MRPTHVSLWFALLLLPGFADAAPRRTRQPVTTPPAATAETADPLRLNTPVVPTFQRVALTVDARRREYSGTVDIDVRVPAATRTLRFHARDMRTMEFTLRGAKGVAIPLTWALGTYDIVTATAAQPIAPGSYTLHGDFTTDFNTKAVSLYRLDTGGHAYSFTQFEAIDARGAFPCWDEPQYKIPWQITLTVPRTDLALSNAPIVRETPTGDSLKTVEFARTPPMPSYLVAMATGPFDTMSVAGCSIPTRIVTAKGALPNARLAAQFTPPVLAALEKYFARPYPFAKLDLIAVPEYWYGAMENPGAITFVDNNFLLDATSATLSRRRWLASTIAHELGHMWFGDLVTMRWWDDLWLNESFAEWIATKITDQVYPEFGAGIDQERGAQRAYDTDQATSTHAMRRPVVGDVNLDQLADALAYRKGEACLRMFEQWLGPEAFRQGVLAYLRAHEWGNATADDLWAALAQTSGGKDVPRAMATFLDQPGVPLVSVTPLGDGTVRLAQRRFAPYGESVSPQVWQIPVTLRYPKPGDPHHTQTVLLTDSVAVVRLDGLASDPAWLMPNADDSGYYRWWLPQAPLVGLREAATQVLSARERMALLANLHALLDAGLLHADEFMATVGRAAGDVSPDVIGVAAGLVDDVRQPFITEDLRAPFAQWVRASFTPAIERLGRTPRAGEDEKVGETRAAVLSLLARDGDDDATLAFADSLARVFLRDPQAVDPALIEFALGGAARRGDRALWETYKERFEKAATPADRNRFLFALGRFRDPALVAATLEYQLSGPLRPQELLRPTMSIGADPRFEDQLWRWMTEHYDAIAGRLPPAFRHFLAFFAGGCEQQRFLAAKAFFQEPAHNASGTEETLKQVEAGVRDCASLRSRESERVRSFLGAPPAGSGQ